MRWILVLLALLLSPAVARERPRLVVVIVLDQFRADYLDRYYDQFLPDAPGKPGGFRYLLDQGAWQRQCFYDHFPMETSVGHTALATGALPAQHGIISNSWYDRRQKKIVQSMEDPANPRLFSANRPIQRAGQELGASPRNLIGTTLGDELKNAVPGSKVVGVSIKERAAILMAGHRADLAIWYDELTGNWISSRYYGDSLPDWVERFNREDWAGQRQGWLWQPEKAQLVGGTRPQNQGASDRGRFGKMPTGTEFFELLGFTPLGDAYTLLAARRAIEGEQLGQDEAPDVLFISLSSLDKLGHQQGPYSPEIQDLLLRSDRELAGFFAFLQQKDLLRHTVVAMSGDHGGMALPESCNLPSGRLHPDRLSERLNQALSSVLGPGQWVIDCHPPEVYLDPRARRPDALRAACQAAEEMAGVEMAISALDIETNQLQPGMVTGPVARSYHRKRSPDMLVVMSPYWLATDRTAGTSHNPVWNYDTHVPLLMRGPGIRKGWHIEPCTPRDLAPTLCELLRIPPPAASSGRVLNVLEVGP
ncbi:MAG: hypothetical protein AMXMBFR33_38910 [Candidatus Xenobia bacterium]